MSQPAFASNLGTRASVFDRAFAPFGESYDNFGTTDSLNFTGDTQDTIAGLFDTPNRELHPNQGRWISPDPAGMSAADPMNPQSWNRYAYVNNNPLSNIDPSGLMCYFIGSADCTDGDDGSGLAGNGGACDAAFDSTCVFDPRTLPSLYRQNGQINLANNIFSGEDCLGCFPVPSVFDSIWSTLLGLPTDLNCPQWMGPMCGGMSPILDGLGLGIPPLVDPKVALGTGYGAGQCIADGVQLRKFSSLTNGCMYLCHVIVADPLVDPLGATLYAVGHFRGPQIDSACGPGTFCPPILTIEAEPPIGPLTRSNANILSCWPD